MTIAAHPGIDELVATAQEFARNELRPVALRYDETEEYPWELFYRGAELGFTCYDLPRAYGGGGVEALSDSCRVIEELTWGDSPIALVITQGGFFAGPVLALGTEEQKQRWLPPLCSPRPPACAVAITEPEAGSDASAITTYARRVDGGYVIDGHKKLIGNAPVAERCVVFATVRARYAVEGDHRLCRRTRRPRVRDRRAVAEDGKPLLPGRGAALRVVLRPRRPSSRSRGRRLSRADAHV